MGGEGRGDVAAEPPAPVPAGAAPGTTERPGPAPSAAWRRLTDEVAAFPEDVRGLRVAPDVTPGEIRAALEAEWSFQEPVPLETVVERLAGVFRRGSLHVTHPRYFGLFNPSVLEAGVVGDALAALYNPQLAAWSHAPAACEVEGLVLRHLAGVLGLGPGRWHANFTSGGAEANLSAVLAALAWRLPDTGEAGVAGAEARPLLYVGAESHHSFVKIARMSGLGTRSLRTVPVTDRFTLDTDALARRIEADAGQGGLPLLIVGTAGTTAAGMVDDLPALADLAERWGAWLHVDAAWGGAAAFSPRLAPVLQGTERADSVTWDAHKWLSVPMGAGMFFCRHPEAVARAFAVDATYMPGAAGADTPEPWATTAQWTRRAIGLKVFTTLAELGTGGYRAMIEGQADLADLLRARLADAGWRVVNDTPLPVVCFTHPDLEPGGTLTARAVADEVVRRGRAWISPVLLGGRVPALRACVTSFRTTAEDVAFLAREVEATRRALGRA